MPFAELGKQLFVVVYLGLTAFYAIRFWIGFGFALEAKQSLMAWPRLAVVAALVPFLFWQPFVAPLYLEKSSLGGLLPDLVLGLALIGSFVWFLRPRSPQLISPTGGLTTFWSRFAVGAAQFIQKMAGLIAALDSKLARAVVQTANAQVVIAWYIEQTERAAIVGIRMMASVAVLPLRWLVDTQGRMEPNRMIWTALAAALVVLWVIA
jgi:hypothetical protein